MSWDYFRDKTGKTFIVNWVGVRAIVRSYLHSKLMWENSQTRMESNWIGPDVYYIHTDFNTVRSKKECLTELVLRDFYDSALISMNVATQMLEQLLAETREYDVQFTKQNKSASASTMYNIEQSVWRGEIAKDVAEVIRNTSAEVLLVGANFAPGPAKYGVLAAGSLLKGTGKYQDSGNIKAGLAEAAFNFGFGLAGLKIVPVNASAAQTVTLNIYLSFGQNFVGEPAKAWLGGEDLSDAIASGTLKAGAAPINELIKEQLSPESLQRIFNSNAKLKAVALPLQVGMNLLSDKTVSAIVDKSKVNSRPQTIPKQNNEELLDTTLLDRRFVENAAVRIYN